MEHEKELAAAAAGLEQALGADARMKSVAAVDLCAIYHDAKPWIERIVHILDTWPVPWGGTIAKALRLLMMIADAFCPA